VSEQLKVYVRATQTWLYTEKRIELQVEEIREKNRKVENIFTIC